MNIIISEQVKAYLKKKNISCLTLNMVIAGNGCCGGYAIPQVSYEYPEDAKKYEYVLVDNIDVYIHKSAIDDDDIKLEFVLRRYLLHEYIDVEGIRIL